MKRKTLFGVGSLLLFVGSFCTSPQQTTAPSAKQIEYNRTSPMQSFAAAELKKALQGSAKGSVRLVTLRSDNTLQPEGFRIKPGKKQLTIEAVDDRGLLYGALEVAEQLVLGVSWSNIKPDTQNPFIRHRGIKLNIPLDARTPSYDDTGDAAQQNIATMWDMNYWTAYLDQLARDRYNLLTLWSLHPYPSWVSVPEYPDVALQDICVYTDTISAGTNMKWFNKDIQNPKNLRVIKRMRIEEKTKFWKQVFQYATDRGIDIHIYHWNVFVNGAEGKHGITWQQDNPVTVDYMRKSIKAFLLTYPMVKGIGVTAGEHINRSLEGEYSTESWMWKTYGQGIMDAKKENPAIDVRFIFRQHWSNLDKIQAAFKDYKGSFETSFKYSRARMYSSTTPPWLDSIFRADVERAKIPCWLNIRNDDLFNYRWGDPVYTAAYFKNMPRAISPGYFVGPDGYVWGKSFNSKTDNRYDFERHWYNNMQWGRLGYNPYLSSDFFKNRLKQRFPEADDALLYETWRATSAVISWTDKIHFRQNDAQFSPEGCFDNNRFHDVNMFIQTGAMPVQGVQSIANYANTPRPEDGISPYAVADSLRAASKMLLQGATQLKKKPVADTQLRETLGDLEAMGHLGAYYAYKVEGATALAQYRVSGDSKYQKQAIESLEKAVSSWTDYARVSGQLYTPQLYARTQQLDWFRVLEWVKKDVDIAREAKPGQEVKVSDDNRLWIRDVNKI